MERYIKIAREYYLSDSDLKKATDGKCNIIPYQELDQYNNIDSLLGTNGCAFVLVELHSETSGHWVFIQRNHHNILEYFDSYGGKPDEYIYKNKHHINKKGGKMIPNLTLLLLNSGENIIYNPFKFQKLSKDIASCGRWVLLRYMFRRMALKDFIKLFKKEKYNFSRDDLSVLLTSMLF